MDSEDRGLCEGCSQIDLKRHIYGENGLRYRIRDVDMGSICILRERSGSCVLCRGVVQSFGSSAAEDSHCHLYATSFCMCPLTFSDEHDETLVCQHPKHLVFRLDSQPPRYAGFQICLDPRATLLWETSDTNAVEIVEVTDETYSTGRKISEEVDLRLVRRWLDLCEHHHGTECRDAIWPGSPPQPKYFLVVDVEQQCIVSAPPDCRFVALSYVWGSAQQKKLTLKNWDVFSQAGALVRSDLPATICDAMLLTRAIGERYCWVDALCIFQDDPASQQDQISQMGAIYSRALITIVNAGGDGSTGLPGLHAGTRILQQIKIQLQGFDLIKVVDDEDIYTDSGHISMWEKRTWTYQEHLFSKRMIIFRKQQVYWHCRSATWIEQTILETRGIRTALASVEKMIHRLPDIPRDLTEQSRQSLGTVRDKEYDLYTSFVQGYTLRQLSHRSDALNAFAGVCRALSLLGKDEFIWGLPKSSFADALTWTTRDPQKNTCLQNVLLQDGLVSQLPFPSWSWASQFCGTSTKLRSRIENSVKGTALEPGLIVFFSCLVDGGMTRITPCPVYRNEPSQNNWPRNSITAQWLGHPRVIPNVTKSIPDREIVHSGTLKFWTSVATIYFFCERQRLRGPPRRTFLSPNGDILIATAHLDSQAYIWRDDPRIPKEVRLAELKNPQGYDLQGDCDVTILDLVIVHGEIFEITNGVSGLSGTGRILYALSVS